MSVSSEKIIALRNDLGWSQSKLAILSGISERTIQRIEQDGYTCSLETKLALAAAFDVPAPALSPADDKSSDGEIALDRNQWMNSPRVGMALLAAYLLILSKFNFPLALAVFLVSVISLLLMSSIVSMAIYGVAATRKLFGELRWHDRSPGNVSELGERVRQAKTLIIGLYLFGLFLPHLADVVLWLVTLALPEPIRWRPIGELNVAIPAGYLAVAVVMAEFWLRPYKHQMEKTLKLAR